MVALIKRSAFLPIASPRLVKEPSTGPDWLHEVKFDGFRLQSHKLGGKVRLFSKNGKDFTDRFPSIAGAVLLRRLPEVKRCTSAGAIRDVCTVIRDP